jgi:SAM-dependent methyltransferase
MFKCEGGEQYLSEYLEVREAVTRDHFNRTKLGFSGYSRSRGLRARIVPGRDFPLEGYEDFVKQINGESLEGVISREVNRNPTVSILDVCCGRGRFLRDCFYHPNWKGKIQPSGIDVLDFYRYPDPSDLLTKSVAEEYKGIDIKVGDAQDLGDIYKGSSFNIITAMLGLYYFADPLHALQDISNLLKVGGRGYVYSCPIPIFHNNERQWFMDYLKDQGIDCGEGDPGPFYGFNIAIHRENLDEIAFPLKYDGWDYSGWEMGERFHYRLDR